MSHDLASFSGPDASFFGNFGTDLSYAPTDYSRPQIQADTKVFLQWLKRFLDVTIAIVALIALSPLFAAIAFMVGRDGHAVLFGHERIGQHGRSFKCRKFRTMVVDGDAVLRDLLARDPAAAAEWRETRKLRRDPRVTPIGRFLRASSLDELPQLFNVVRGEMSLVGPRPIVAAEMPKYGERIGYYLAVPPGMTGAWQISGRSDTSYGQRVELDTDYVRNWSLTKDISILLRTIPAVALSRGAV